MINVVVGKPGMGKTYMLVRKACEFLDEGRDVYSNFPIDINKLPLRNKDHGKLLFWTKLTDLIRIKQGIVLIDEAQIYFNSRGWKDLPLEVQYKFQQHRKHGVDIWGSVQNIKRIDTVVRELVNNVWLCKKIGRLFFAREYDVEEIDKAKRSSYGWRFYWLTAKYYRAYDTMFEIAQNKLF